MYFFGRYSVCNLEVLLAFVTDTCHPCFPVLEESLDLEFFIAEILLSALSGFGWDLIDSGGAYLN